ncbi:ubiquitin carboxyl-terminal hydrolase 44 [Sarcophilus harrisii]|nr:ubiquitin carboxyl-terminal hydrolase 44 [Sarcophilus harrisii]XP_031794465.1 ubiquitin carboxyl-terminal hydrolase 44 [Sarcophilus harrisii]XP_031794466.1 ubiquitin carboxyl-terminal hydrolase 44 [Sarcophilus harrisii]XP_031794467.1 ubiquitin carboxyl-terminal hydrolase 44 [Sarcophilus harrisii]
MDKCKHVGRLRLAQDHSILNPQKWHCVDCNTTDSVWACLSCSHVACGRYIEEHALKHFQDSNHPVALEVNELYVFCYLCDDYVLNDNATGDLKLLRSTLSAIKSQNYNCTTRSGRILRSMGTSDDSYPSHGGAQALLRNEDQMFTALWHRRRMLMGKVFRSWYEQTPIGKRQLEEEKLQEEAEAKREEARRRRQELKRQFKAEMERMPPRKSSRLQGLAKSGVTEMLPIKKLVRSPASPVIGKKVSTSHEIRLKKVSDSPIKRRPTVTPGVTGLRNLGNTCYMNSILQVLSHLLIFRQCFLKLDLNQTQELLATAASGKTRSSCKHPPVTDSMFHIKENQEKYKGSPGLRRSSLSSGLSGGASKSRSMELIQPREPSSKYISLCHELHTLFQVMWSGKWALVSPFAMLHSVWRLIPAFRGYAQQDAQEFLCELLDKVQHELETTGTRYPALIPSSQKKLIKQVLNVVNTIFHGQLLSQVTCLACDNKSNTVEPFWDLSLEFPERYHCNGKEMAAQYPCLVTEMLAKFTETEALEGKIYVCDQCNTKRRKFSSKPVILTEAQKQLMVCRLPQVLRLHLKRFRWSGRNHREKIGVHVGFDEILNMEPYCYRESLKSLRPECFIYDLSAVVMHHGKGFGSGHYTAYCYNSEGGFWVHCNDSKLNMCTLEEVCKAQAYILFYTQRAPQEGEYSRLSAPELLSPRPQPAREEANPPLSARRS